MRNKASPWYQSRAPWSGSKYKVDALRPTANAIPLQRPTAAPHFTGREAELAELRQLVAPGRIVTLTGMGGMGKTSIAAKFVEELFDGDQPPAAFPGGVIVHGFYDDSDIERAADHIAKSCLSDPPDEMLSDPLGAMAVRLGGRTALLVLDGAEAADNLPKLLERCAARSGRAHHQPATERRLRR